MKKHSFIYISIFIVIVSWWFFVRNEQATVEINGQIFKVEVVADEETRTQGLSGRDSLAVDKGMLFIFPQAKATQFWMKDMNFAIDLLWINDNKIVGYEKNMQPPALNIAEHDLIRYVSPMLVDKVLEIPTGSIEQLDIKVGDIININI